jgi:hypothetical protein
MQMRASEDDVFVGIGWAFCQQSPISLLHSFSLLFAFSKCLMNDQQTAVAISPPFFYNFEVRMAL